MKTFSQFYLLIFIGLACLSPAMSAFASEDKCVNGNAAGAECKNMDVLSYVFLSDLNDIYSPGDEASDIWGWNDPVTGKEYAIIGLYDATVFVDISDPLNPKVAARLSTTPPVSKPSSLKKLCHDDCGGNDDEVEVPGEEAEASSWMDIKVYGDVAYIGSEESEFGVLVFDLRRLRAVSGGQWVVADGHLSEVMNSHNLAIDQDNGFLYAVGDTAYDEDGPGWGGAHVYDLTDPLHPVYLTEFVIDPLLAGSSYLHDLWCGTYQGPDTNFHGKQVCFGANSGRERDSTTGITKYFCNDDGVYSGDWVFDNKGTDDSDDELIFGTGCIQTRSLGFRPNRYSYLVALDVTDKNNVHLLDRATFQGSRYIHQQWPTKNHDYLYVNDELEESYYAQRTKFYIYDLSDLTNLQQVSTFEYPGLDIDHNIYVHGRFAYQSNYSAGLRMLDVSDPTSPLEVGYLDLRPGYSGVRFTSNWSNYVFPSGIIAISDIETGLILLRPELQETTTPPDLVVDGDVFQLANGELEGAFYVYNNGTGPATEVEVIVSGQRWWDSSTGNLYIDTFDYSPSLPTDPSISFNCHTEGPEMGIEGSTFYAGETQIRCTVNNLPSCTGLYFHASYTTFDAGSTRIAATGRQLEAVGTTANNTNYVSAAEIISVSELPALSQKRDALRASSCGPLPQTGDGGGAGASGEDGGSGGGSASWLLLLLVYPAVRRRQP